MRALTCLPNRWQAKPSPYRCGASRVIQPTRRLLDQGSLPSCVGYAVAAGLEPQCGQDVSPEAIWREARRIQGDLGDIELGTRVEYALQAIATQGYQLAGETSLVSQSPSELLDSYDRHGCKWYDVPCTGDWQARLTALLDMGFGVTLSGLVGERYLELGKWHSGVLGAEYLGEPDMPAGGHAQRIRGVDTVLGRRAWLIQNSWGANWGGCLVGDVWEPGHVWVADDAIALSWGVSACRLPSK